MTRFAVAAVANEMSICSLGIMGTKYERATEIPDEVTMDANTEYTLAYAPLVSKYPIGNTIDIRLRQGSGA